MKLLDLFASGGWMMIPLLGCSVVGIAIIGERLWFFHKIRTSQADSMIGFIQNGKFPDALALAETNHQPVLKVLAAGVLQRSEEPTKTMEIVSIEVLASMRRGLGILETIITISPFLGLLGTILGLIKSFRVLETSNGLNQPIGVVGGVAEALITTVVGLSIALLTVIPYNYFLGRIEDEKENIEKCRYNIINFLNDTLHRFACHGYPITSLSTIKR